MRPRSVLAGVALALLVSYALVPTSIRAGSAPEAAGDRPVRIVMTVPADAAIWFDATETVQRGNHREFVSPRLKAGHEYSYTLRVRWMNNGQPVEQLHRVGVHAGEMVNLNFGSEPTSVAAPVQERRSYYLPPLQAPVSVPGYVPDGADLPWNEFLGGISNRTKPDPADPWLYTGQ